LARRFRDAPPVSVEQAKAAQQRRMELYAAPSAAVDFCSLAVGSFEMRQSAAGADPISCYDAEPDIQVPRHGPNLADTVRAGPKR